MWNIEKTFLKDLLFFNLVLFVFFLLIWWRIYQISLSIDIQRCWRFWLKNTGIQWTLAIRRRSDLWPCWAMRICALPWWIISAIFLSDISTNYRQQYLKTTRNSPILLVLVFWNNGVCSSHNISVLSSTLLTFVTGGYLTSV